MEDEDEMTRQRHDARLSSYNVQDAAPNNPKRKAAHRMGITSSSEKMGDNCPLEPKPVSDELQTFTMKVSSGGDPFTRQRPQNSDNWPRNGSLLKGYEYDCNGTKWLKPPSKQLKIS
ncbi:hypothetical protein CYMTET_12784 [Cymbomonas tetramitiformis]|uniref:Uncharacterized protein n=1 Tax=Cymbomonas tetramitiformis TaxID=36881 RepID=A0AAE0GJE6_9CHLO|nr:hypothetical protein CYMTET_12784 [Cymbomonas tetramitiformis]